MNFESIKSKFIEQLLQDLKSDPKKQDLTAEDISIFDYSDEFKEFIADEYNIDESELSSDITEMLSMELDELDKLVNPQEESEEGNTEANKANNIIAEFLNALFSDEKMKKQIDADGDGKISDEEKENFLNTVGAMDGDDKTISMDDLLKTMEKSEKGKFEIKEAKDTEKIEAPQNASGPSSSGSFGPPPSSSPKTPETPKEESKIPDFSKMTKEEIETELGNAEKNLTEGKDLASSLLNGTEENYLDLKKQADDAYKNYQDELKVLDEDMAKELDTHVKNVEEKEKARDEKLLAVLDQSLVLSDAETTYTECQETTKSLESTLSTLEGSLSSLQSSLSGAEDEEKASIEAQIASVQAQIDATKADLEAAKTAEEEAKTAVTEAQEKLTKLDEDANKATEEVQKAQEEKTAYEQQIAEKYPQIQELQNTYNECKSNSEQYKALAFSEVVQVISDNQDIKNAAKIELSKREDAEKANAIKKDLKLDPMAEYNVEAGEKLKDAALTTRGTTGLCLAGVHESLMEAYGLNMKLPFGSAYMATEYFRGNVEGYEEVAQHFKEVEVAEEDLNSLPAGAIVVWDKGGNSSVSAAGKEHGHISISLGDGRESSDHIQNQITGRGVKFYVFIPVS